MSIRSRQYARIALLLSISFLASCGSPSSPADTQAQVISNGAWSGHFGDLGELSGTGTSAVLTIGTDRQCATVTKLGTSDITRPTILTIRVGDQRVSTPSHEFTVTRTLCGEGLLRD